MTTMTRTEMALASANEAIGWARDYLAAGKASRAVKQLDSAIADGEAELARAKDADTKAAVTAGLALLRSARQDIA